MTTHRRKGSLAAHISIRKCMWLYTGDTIAWRLFNLREDDEVIGIHIDHVAAIAYCPFCGGKLEEETK